MPKRIGLLYQETCSLDNCRQAILEGTANLDKTLPSIQRVRNNIDSYAITMSQILSNGWFPGPVRFKLIKEGPRRKMRRLIIPGLLDHLIHVAIMRPAERYLLKRYDYYSCGSIKEKGQSHAMKGLRKWIGPGGYPYAAECDVYHFYESVKPEIVMSCLRKIFKDERYLQLHELILKQMQFVPYIAKRSQRTPENLAWTNKGLAIGFTPSHWYANLVLTETDRMLRMNFPKIKFVRFMDNYAMLADNKAMLHEGIKALQHKLSQLGLRLKEDWQVFPTSARPVSFLSYRYYGDGRVLIRKQVLFRITRKAKQTKKNFHSYNARGLVSLMGIADHADSYTYKKKYIYPVISIKSCRRYISYVDKKRNLQ